MDHLPARRRRVADAFPAVRHRGGAAHPWRLALRRRRQSSRCHHRTAGEQFPQRPHAHPDGDGCQRVCDHGRWGDDRDHLRGHRPVGGCDLRPLGSRDGARAPVRGVAAADGDRDARPRDLPRRQPAVRPRQWSDGHRARRASVHHYARHDVDAPWPRVRRQSRREHPRAIVVDERRQGAARPRHGAVSGAAAGDARGGDRGERVPGTHGDGPARVRGRRQRRGEPLLRIEREPGPGGRLRAVRDSAPASPRFSAPDSTGRRRRPMRTGTNST